MSYKIETEYLSFSEKSKDDVIARLLALFSQATEYSIRVEWPDGAYIEYEGVEE